MIAEKAIAVVPSVAREPNSRADGQDRCANDMAAGMVPEAREPKAARDDGQKVRADKAMHRLPSSPQHSAEESGQCLHADKARVELPIPPRFSNDPSIQDIIAEARNRTYWMNMRLRNTARVAAELRRFIQPTRGQEDEWSEDTKKLALAIVHEAVEAVHHAKKSAMLEMAGKKARARIPKLDHPLLQNPIAYGSAIALADYESREDESLARMVDVVSGLPIASFVNDRCKGFSLAGLAVLIGHAGDFRDYPKKGHLWKRLGLAPFSKDGVTRAGSTWGRLGGLSAGDWTELGYKRSRLGDIFGKIVQPLFRAQWQTPGNDDAGEKIPACAQGRYGEVFGRYKARQKALNESGAFAAEAERQVAAAKKGGRKPQKALLEGKLPDSQINSRALRRMAQKLVADLLFEWRRLDHGKNADKAKKRLSTAAESIEGKANKRLPHDAAKIGVPDPQSNAAPGFLATLTPKQRERALAYASDDSVGETEIGGADGHWKTAAHSGPRNVAAAPPSQLAEDEARGAVPPIAAMRPAPASATSSASDDEAISLLPLKGMRHVPASGADPNAVVTMRRVDRLPNAGGQATCHVPAKATDTLPNRQRRQHMGAAE